MRHLYSCTLPLPSFSAFGGSVSDGNVGTGPRLGLVGLEVVGGGGSPMPLSL